MANEPGTSKVEHIEHMEEEEAGEEEAGEEELEEEEEEFLPGYQTMQDYSTALLREVVKATKAANSLPGEGDDFDYYCSFPGFRTFCSKMESRVTRSISRLIRHQSLPCYWPPPPAQAPPTSGQGEEAGLVAMVEERMEAIIEANDILLERVGVLMDEACGLRKKREEEEAVLLTAPLHQGTAEVASWNENKSSGKKSKYSFMASRNVPRPQVRFRDQVDNSNSVFVPLLRSKPNARQPLPSVYQRLQSPQSLNALIANTKEWAVVKEKYTHPYRFELENFIPTEAQLQLHEPQAPGSLEEVPYQFISREEELESLVTELSQCSEFAIDLENHSYRSFQGFVCLMQISTRNHDYIIDTLELRHLMYRLLDPFTDPNIVKVMHGADWDIPWLQRDFGLYVVNLFDTGVASHVLQLPKHSLAFLLQYCCGVEADKQYQLADWRIRPLPAEMEKYAREDTHYLLYIYDRMRNELIRRKRENQDPLRTTFSKSRDVCLKTYHKPTFSKDSYLRLYYKHKRNFNSQQLHCLKLLYEWRDHVARDEDENTGYVLPNHMLFQIAEQLPREAQGVLACCIPVPPLLRQQLQEVFILVQEARETPATQELPKFRVPEETTPPATPISTAIDAPQTQNTPHSEPVVTGVNPKPHLVQLTGPPVVSAPTSMSAIERVVPEVSERVRQQLRKIQSSFPDILSQFMESSTSIPSLAVPPPMMTTAPVTTPAKGQERASAGGSGGVEERESATPTDTRAPVSNSGTPNTTVPRHTTEGGGAKTTANRGKTKKKRKVSARELGRGGKRRKVSPPEEGELRDEEEEEEGEGRRGAGKKIKLTEKDFKEDEFTPFSYGGVDFADYTTDSAHPPLVVFQPQSASGGRKGRGGARSKVIQRSGDKSLTHSDTTRRQTHSQRLWPKGN